MKYIKISEDVYCKESDIVLVLHARRAGAKALLRDKLNHEPTDVYDICGGRKRQTLIVMRTGKMVLTNYGFNLILNRVNDEQVD